MDPLSEHACEAATATSRLRGNAEGMTRRPPMTTDRLTFSELRAELRRGVRFTQQHEDDQPQDDQAYMTRSDDQRSSYGPRDAARARTHSTPVFAVDDDDSEEIAAFLGLSIDTDNQHSLPVPHRAASFSGTPRSRMVPCSPPVPIPQTHWQRRRSGSTSSGSRSSGSALPPSQDRQYSRTQCEAQLWDEYWNYKLSLESRESFEASTSNNQRDERESPLSARTASINQDQKTKPRTTSEASTEDTIQDSGDDDHHGEADVFDMDDL